mmetsp:Transcript_14301/g.28134  ORF Transcript_14301/g.28134 Transcript_14301/m.28134 type:complete len:89 (-) Transcript_14301:1053-1319(-)
MTGKEEMQGTSLPNIVTHVQYRLHRVDYLNKVTKLQFSLSEHITLLLPMKNMRHSILLANTYGELKGLGESGIGLGGTKEKNFQLHHL